MGSNIDFQPSNSDGIDFQPIDFQPGDKSLLHPTQAAVNVPYPANTFRDLWDTIKEKASELYNAGLGEAQKVNDVLNYPSQKVYEQLTHPTPGVDISNRPGVKTVSSLVAGAIDPRNLPLLALGEAGPAVRSIGGGSLAVLQGEQAGENLKHKEYGKALINASLAGLGALGALHEGANALLRDSSLDAKGTLSSEIDFQPHSVGSAAPGDLDQTAGSAGLATAIAPEGAPSVEAPREALPTIKALAQKATDTLKALADTVNQKPKAHGIHGAVDRFSGLIQKSRFGAWQFRNAILKAVPDQLTRQGITQWIEAGGDADLLKQRMADVPDAYKPQFQAALNLNDAQKTIARNIENYFGEKLQTGQEAGLLSEGRKNYVPQAWEENEQVAINSGGPKLSTYLPNARQRVFGSFAEGMKAGYTPVTTDVAEIIPEYDRVFTRALASRQFVKWLSSNVASDQRPLVARTGGGGLTADTAEGPNVGPILANPDIRPEAASDYQVLNSPALKGWKFVTQTLNGPVMVKSDLAVHPEVAEPLNRLLDTRGLGHGDYLPAKLFKTYQRLGSQIKGAMFSFSPFHAVNIGGIAESLRINPFYPPHVDVNDPLTGELLDHGLTLGTERMAEGFSSQGAPWVQKIPVVGPLQHRFENWMFGPDGYLSRIKVAIGKTLIARNTKLYGTQLDRDQIVKLSATEANNAVGGQNLDSMFRSRKFQDGLRAIFLAPDFLESRARFNLGALTKYGGAQRQSLALDFAQRYVLARVLNQVINGQPYYDMPFGVKVGKKRYDMRSNIGDVLEFAESLTGQRANPFLKYRINPLARGLEEAFVTHRDAYGRPESTGQALLKTAEQAIPIGLQGLAGIGYEPSLAESIGTSIGIHDRPYYSPAGKILHDAAMATIPPQAFTHKSPVGKAVGLIRDGNVKAAQQMVKAGTLSPTQFKRAVEIGRTSPLVEDAKRAPVEALVQAYDKATPEERSVLKSILLQRAARAERQKPADEAERLRKQVAQLAGE